MAAPLILFSTLLCSLALFEYYRRMKTSLQSNPGLYLGLYALGSGVLAAEGFFMITDTLPPRLALAVLPVVFSMVWFGTRRVSAAEGRPALAFLALISTVRIPVEIALHLLAEQGQVPVAMTWSGSNFDIFSGVTAPFVAWLVHGGKISKTGLLAWNLLCLCLLLNVVVTAVLSAPFPFQMLNFRQPNYAVLAYPYALLPVCIVPAVLFTHLRSLRLLFSSTFALNDPA